METNPILKELKENDIVLLEVPSQFRNSYKEIVRIFNLKLIPADKDCSCDWLEFNGEILYTNHRIHKSHLNYPFGNCLSIVEKISPKHIEKLALTYNLWKATENMLSDSELEYQKICANNFLKF